MARQQYYLALIFVVSVLALTFKLSSSSYIQRPSSRVFEDIQTEINGDGRILKSTEFSSSSQLESTAKTQPENTVPTKNSVLIYNRIPKTGSTTFANICNRLSTRNKFWTVNLNASLPNGDTVNCYVWPPGEQREFLTNITTWRHKMPALYHGHFSFIQPDKYLIPNANAISYINIIRNPLDRLVSYYYFLRYGDDFRPNKVRKNHNDHRSIDQCVAETYENLSNPKEHQDCGPEKIWMQIPFFCGQFTRCWDKNSRKWAFEMAVNNFYKYYSLVGYTDGYSKFIEMLEDIFPEFFRHTSKYLENDWGGLEKMWLRHTKWKQEPSEETIATLQKTEEFKYEMLFYQMVKREFDDMYHRSYVGGARLRKAKVNYNKIYNQKGKFRDDFRNY